MITSNFAARYACAGHAIVWACVLLLSGCGFKEYRAKPIDQERTARQYTSRTLGEPKLKEYLVKHNRAPASWPLPAWTLQDLTLAAVFFHPEIELARARARVAEAETATSKLRANPTLTIRPEYNSKVDGGETPWGLGLIFGMPTNFGSKRQIRTEQLSSLQDAAWLDVGAASWRVRSRLRRNVVDYYIADQNVRLLEAEAAERRMLVSLVEKREKVGVASSIDTSNQRVRLIEADVAAKRASVRREQALGGIAEALGVPLSEIATVKFDFRDLDAPPAAFDGKSAQRIALLNRMDVRRKLAEYSAAESAVKLEVARQYPELILAPGYLWDVDEAIWSLAFLSVLPLKERRGALIREAEARREAEENAFRALQASVIAETATAVARYRRAREANESVRMQLQQLTERRARLEKQFSAGYADRVEMVTARLEAVAAERAAVTALFETQQGLSALEDALQRPTENPELFAIAPASGAPAPQTPTNPALIDDD